MSKHDNHHSGRSNNPNKAGVHKDWRMWTVVLLMVVGMLVYILTDDESIVPGQPPQEQVPIEAGDG